MASSCHELHCLHCDAAVLEMDLAEGWCSGCGKRLPGSFQEAIKPSGRTAVAITEPEASRRERLVCGGVIFALMSLLALVFIQNLL